MALNLSTLTSPTTSSDVIADIENPADSSDLVVTLKNLATESGATTNATQTVSAAQGTALQGKGLYIPNVSNNYATGPSVTIGANETWEGEVDMMVTDFGPSSNYLLPMGGGEWSSGFGFLFYSDGTIRPFGKSFAPFLGPQPSGVTLGTAFNVKYGFDGTNLYVDIDNVSVFTSTAPSQSGSITHPLELNQQTLTQQGGYMIQKAKLTVGSSVVFDCDFTSNNIPTGATSFTADSGQVVTINQSGDDFARISKGSHLIMDLVDDEYEFTTDAAIDGTIVVATTEGTYSAGISLDASTQYDLQARGVAASPQYGFLKNVIGYLITPSQLSDSEITNIEAYFVDKGAAARSAFGSVTAFNGAWRDCESLTSFPAIDTSSGTNFFAAWYHGYSLTSFPLLDTSSGTNFSYSWDACNSLTSFPLLDTSSGESFTNTWAGCTSLTSFPLIDTSSGTSFSNAWKNCNSLTSFPLLNTSSGTNFNSTWRDCTSLTSFPLINTSSGSNLTAAWQSCTSLSSFPLIDTSAATTLNRTWSTCSSLTSFPAINASLSTDFFQTWNGCVSLTSFPLIDVSLGQRFSFTWQKCTNLTTFPAGFFDSWSPTSLFNAVFQEAWGQCTSLTPQSVENILTSLDTSGVYGTNTGASGGTQLAYNIIDIDYDGGTLSSATTTAITDLKAKNWAIKINNVTQ